MEVTCANCGTALRRSPSHVRPLSFCNVECRKAYHRPLIPCRGCEASFPRNPKEPGRQYCTWECFKASRHVQVTCVVCEAGFDSYLSEQRKREERSSVACCSADCRNVYTSLLLGGDGTWVPGGRHNPKKVSAWRWLQCRRAYLAMVGDVCEGCGGARVEHVHHLHPRAMGGALYDFGNLMAVCWECHDNMHAQLREGAFWDSFEGVAFDAALAGCA